MKPEFHDTHAQDDDTSYDDRPSKSQIKREMLALQDLGTQLIELSTDRLKQLPISERLYEALRDAQRTTSREGKRRATAFVGKLMRDAPVDDIRRQLDIWENGSREETRAMHRLEAMREKLLQDDDTLTHLLTLIPQSDVQEFRTLVRAARKENTANESLNPGQEPQRKHYRALFQSLKGLQAEGIIAQ